MRSTFSFTSNFYLQLLITVTEVFIIVYRFIIYLLLRLRGAKNGMHIASILVVWTVSSSF